MKGAYIRLRLGDVSDPANVIRYAVLEGSFYYLTASDSGYRDELYLNAVSRIEENAVTDCAEDMSGNLYVCYNSAYLNAPDLNAPESKPTFSVLLAANTDVFEDGWFKGYTEKGLGACQIEEDNNDYLE